LGQEIVQLLLLGISRAVKMVGAYFQTVAMSQVNVFLVFAVYPASTFRGFQIHIGHVGIIAYRFPEYRSLVMAEVNSLDIMTRILVFCLLGL
jgi:hypothetical protein